MKKENLFISSNVKENTLLAVIIKNYKTSSRLDITNVEELLQTSILSLKKNDFVRPHKHNFVKREILGTHEVWIVYKGRGMVSFYDVDDQFLCSKRVTRGDMVLNFRGGHGLKAFSRKMVFIEIKNGPYKGPEIDKVSIDT